MPATDMERELRPATLDNAALVADLESKRDPQEPRDPVMLRYWWQMGDELERGRGIAQALKYQSMAKAIEVGYTRVRTSNDAENPAILRINAQMGNRPVAPIIELHSSL
jgi:hypothetical protein